MNTDSLDSLMMLVAGACLAYVAAHAVRVRVRRPLPRLRWHLPGPLARATSLLGLTVALASLPATRTEARSRFPRPRDRAFDPPWSVPHVSRPLDVPPPRQARNQVGSSPSRDSHPAIHGVTRHGDRKRSSCRLFPRFCGPRPAHHVVMPGDSLWSIARSWLGTDDPERIAAVWPLIYRANKGVIGPDPNLIRPGQVLEMPDRPMS
ncbi:MAG TPA: LysM domain-containing protein [Actinomycetota bacterium]|nr:LysM domain-containing protein [Actinomycetota bacterium]